MQIAIVDYKVVPSNPAGGCHWRLLRALSKEHSFTVFSVEFDNPDPDRIEWVRIPAPSKPLALLFVMYHLMAPIIFYLYCWRRHKHFDLVQIVESKFSFGDVSYAHFCHRHYLRRFWRTSRPKGARRLSRWLDHKLHAAAEQWVFRRVRRVVVPSTGLLREIEHEYQYTEGRIQVIANPIEIEALERPGDFDRASFRRSMALDEEDQVLIFVALGHFERKGLPALMQAIAQVARPRLKLVVVGGSDPLLDTYKDVAAGLGIEAQVRFAGRRSDVRPYFWAGDAFILPSTYETFSLVTYEAAAAGLPLIVAPTNGISDILRDGANGIQIGTDAASIRAGLECFLSMSEARRQSMGDCARTTVREYSVEAFTKSWRSFYQSHVWV